MKLFTQFVTSTVSRSVGVLLFVTVCTLCGFQPAKGELHWQDAKKEQMKVRLIVLAASYPRSSVYSNQEVFIAAQEIEPGEARLVKLVYEFLPYQPRLSESGFDYSTLHELRATRNPECDETLGQMASPEKNRPKLNWEYATDSPGLDPGRRRRPLPCYQTTAEDYTKPIHQPAGPSPEF
ncbi:MAG: hypothetical protein JWO91_1355 [Acidobacteriaceae bacterium]|nr:hypothetical protein [Acidobacteriaceae bacterium]